MRKPRFVIYQDKAGQWRWHLKAANNRIVCQGECHTRRRDAVRAAETVQELAALARIEGV